MPNEPKTFHCFNLNSNTFYLNLKILLKASPSLKIALDISKQLNLKKDEYR